MFVKMMSGEDLPDTDPKKNFELVECIRAKTEVVEGRGKVVKLDFDGDGGAWMNFTMKGNVYFLNDYGKTIECASPNFNKN